MAKTACRATSITATAAGGTALEAAFPISCAIIDDDEIAEKQFSDSRQKSIFGGSEVKGLRLTVCDLEFYNALKKGTRVTTAVVKLESAYDADGTLLTTGDALTATLTGGYVSEAVELESSNDGNPIEYAITIMLCRGKDGTEGTFAVV